jgi:hypothetical protein
MIYYMRYVAVGSIIRINLRDSGTKNPCRLGSPSTICSEEASIFWWSDQLMAVA